tara:strand:+ start:3415 stop:4671 length:1257 start_codon:yes stop_codon:yes gene_type:complete
MSIFQRRTTLRKTSISINGIRNSFSNFNKGIMGAKSQADDIVRITRERNIFKRRLISKDNEFFRKRQENAKRREREDEIEAQDVRGVTKRQGNLFQRSTKGFLGRILDFLGILLIGWAVTNLPKIISAIQGLIKRIQKVVSIFTGFFNIMKNFFIGVKEGLDNILGVFKKFNFKRNRNEVEEGFLQAGNSISKLNKDFITTVNEIAKDPDLQGLDELADEIETGGSDTPEIEQVKPIETETETEKKETTKIEGRAEGGPFDSRQPILVGEEGPEIVQFDQSGEVIDNENTMDILSGLNMMPDDELMDKSSPNESRSGKFPILSFDTPEDRTSIPDMESNIDGVNKRNTFVNAVTIQRPDLSQGRKKLKTQVIIVDKKSTNMQQPQISNTKPNDIVVRKGQSTLSSLLALQSVGALKYT